MAGRLDWLSPEGIEKVDDMTVKLTLSRPYADVPLALYDYPSMIAPEGGWTDFYSGNPADAIGTGPFLMEEFIPDERMVLVRNPNYWRKGADGQPLPHSGSLLIGDRGTLYVPDAWGRNALATLRWFVRPSLPDRVPQPSGDFSPDSHSLVQIKQGKVPGR